MQKSTANKKKTMLDFKEINVSKYTEVLKMTKRYYAEQAMTALIAEHMHFLFLILKKSGMSG